MSYDLQEQEQVEALKAWWKANANRVTWLAAAVLIVILAYQGWSWYQSRQALAASALYEQFDHAAESKDPKDAAKAREVAGTLIERHASTVYAAMAALRQAKSNVDAGDPKAAKAQLAWAADHASAPELALLARVRLAGLQLDEKAYDEALKTLDVKVPDAFAAEFANRRGDVYAAEGKVPEARAAYSEALARAGTLPIRSMIQLKLDALPAGGA